MARQYKKHKPTKFERLWGIDVQDLAQAEQLSPAAMLMRVHLYGTPYQRAKRPNVFEEGCGRAPMELWERSGLNTSALFSRFCQYGDPFKTPQRRSWGKTQYDPSKIKNLKRKDFWLHPKHPDYQKHRDLWIPFLHKIDPDAELGYIDKYGDL